jgi:hypothetical protein
VIYFSLVNGKVPKIAISSASHQATIYTLQEEIIVLKRISIRMIHSAQDRQILG